jgi:hypothetical protein
MLRLAALSIRRVSHGSRPLVASLGTGSLAASLGLSEGPFAWSERPEVSACRDPTRIQEIQTAYLPITPSPMYRYLS